MKNTITLLVLLFAFQSFAAIQVNITGKLLNSANAKEVILQDVFHFRESIALKNDGTFAANMTLATGYYNFNNVCLVFLDKSGTLNIKSLNGSIVFTGVNSHENTILRKADSLKSTMNYIRLQPTERLNKTLLPSLDQQLFLLQKEISNLLSTPGLSKTFIATQMDDFAYFKRLIYYEYRLHYGINRTKLDEFAKESKTFSTNPKNIDSEDALNNVISKSNYKTARLSEAESKRLDNDIYADFDWNNDALFKFSLSYKKMMDQFLQKLVKQPPTEKALSLPERFEKELTLIFEKSRSNMIRQKYLYDLTRILLTMSKAPDKVYENFLNKSTDEMYRKDIVQRYQKIIK